MGLAVPPLFTCLWFTGPRGRACRPYAHSFAAEFVAIEVGTGCTPRGALVACPHRRSVKDTVPAQGNPNSMPQIRACSKSLVEPVDGGAGPYARPSQKAHWCTRSKSSIMRLPWGCSDITPASTAGNPGSPVFTKFDQ